MKPCALSDYWTSILHCQDSQTLPAASGKLGNTGRQALKSPLNMKYSHFSIFSIFTSSLAKLCDTAVIHFMEEQRKMGENLTIRAGSASRGSLLNLSHY